MNMPSSLSNLVKIRRKPFSRLKSRSISLRFLYSPLSYSQGSVRLFFGGTTGEKPSSAASFLVSSPSVSSPAYALSLIKAHGSETAPSSVSSLRPSGASPAWLGERENITAHSADATTRCSFVVQPPQDLPTDCGPFFLMPRFRQDAL